MSIILTAAMLLNIITIVPVSALVATTDFNHYTMVGKASLSVDETAILFQPIIRFGN